MMSKVCSSACAAAAAVSLTGAPASAANPVDIQWYSVSPNFQDFDYPPCGAYDCGQTYTNGNPEVAVGPLSGGVPIVSSGNPAGLAEGAGRPLQWWTPSAGVTFEGMTQASLPYYNQSMYVSEGTGGSDGSAFQTAIFSATLHVGSAGGTITFGGDDDMFLALNGSIVDQLGGIHPYGSLATYDVGQGTYTMDVFYADRHVVGAVADLSLSGSISTSIAEPSTWAMMALGFTALGLAGARKRRTPVSIGV
jgi:hypothetical protein